MPVELFELMPGAPKVFRCERLLASMTPRACAELKVADINEACMRCPIGAEHVAQFRVKAAHRDINTTSLSPLRLHVKCVRCERTTHRRVGPALCVSCFNRQLEIHHGLNARNSRPVEVGARLHEFCILVAGTLPRQRHTSALAPKVTPLPGGALLELVALNEGEVERLVAVAFPAMTIADIERGQSVSKVNGWLPKAAVNETAAQS